MAKKYPSLKQDIQQLRKDISNKNQLGTDLGGGLHKIRIAISSKGKGKSGGARVLSLNILVSANETEIGFLYIYDKSERNNISDKEIKSLLQEI